MGLTRSRARRPGPRAAMAVALAAALAVVTVPSGPATAAGSAPHAPVGAFVQSSDLTMPQFCTDAAPVSRTRTPTLGVSKGAPAYNTGRPNLMATFEVAPPGQAVVARGTVSLFLDPARFEVPAGVLGEGEYRFRVRAVDGNRVSAWLPWCTFTVDTLSRPALGVPVNLRVSPYPYSGFQLCGAEPPVVLADYSPTFAASPATGSVTPNLVARFEVARPGQDTLDLAGNPYGVAAPQGSLPAGSYQVRARFEDGDATSDWSPWCDFSAA